MRARLAALAAVGLAALMLGWVPAARAATIAVTPGAVDAVANGNCSVREAITAANTDSVVDACRAGAGADAIRARGTFVLTVADNDANGLPVISSPVRIDHARISRASGGPAFRIFAVASSGTLTLNAMTISGGLASNCPDSADVCGGAIANDGALIVNGSRIVNNTAIGSTAIVEGGALDNNGTATVVGSVVSGNSAVNTSLSFSLAVGGAINNQGTLNLRSSAIGENTTSCSGSGSPLGCFALGGAIYNPEPGTLNMQSTRLSHNSASCSGSGCFAVGGGMTNDATAVVRHSQVSRNSASCTASGCTAIGGGIGTGFGVVNLASSQVSGNTASCSTSGCLARGGGIDNDFDGTLNITDSQVVNNTVSAPAGTARGAGLYNGSGTTTVARSAVVANRASGATAEGGGIYEAGGSVVLTRSQITGNTPNNCRPLGSVPGCTT